MIKTELIEMKEIISQIKEIISLQKDIDELHVEVKRLNALHNKYNANKNSKKIDIKDIKQQLVNKTIKMIYAAFLLLIALNIFCSNPFFIPYFIYIEIIGYGVLALCVYITWNICKEALNILERENKGSNITEQTDKDKEHDRIYDELCEKRSYYHALQREQNNLLISLSSNDYQSYLEYIEFCQNLDEEMKNSQEPEHEQLAIKEEKRESFLKNLLIKKIV